MPTLMFPPDSNSGTAQKASVEEGSTTMYNSDDSTVFDENFAANNSTCKESIAKTSTNGLLKDPMASPIGREKHNKSVTFDESFILMSTGKRGRYSRRDTLNSDVSLLSCDASNIKERSILESISNNEHSTLSEKEAFLLRFFCCFKEPAPRSNSEQVRHGIFDIA